MSTIFNVLTKISVEVDALKLETLQAIIEASDDEHDWDSDYVGSESYPVSECREYIRELANDPDWQGWTFRILVQNDDGCYCLEV